MRRKDDRISKGFEFSSATLQEPILGAAVACYTQVWSSRGQWLEA